MNKLIIIGNGFDLAHGLPTKYSDFVVWYLKKSFESLFSSFENRKNIFEIKNEIFQISSPSRYLNYKQIDSIDSLSKFLEINDIIIKYQNDFVKRIFSNSPKNNQWVNIESEYYMELLNIYNKFIETNKVWHNNQEIEELKNLNDSFSIVKKELIEYLGDIVDKKSVDVDSEILDHFNEIALRGGKAPFRTIILIFNYTKTIELYEKVWNLKKCQIKYIHGCLHDINENPIIFGYGDEMDVLYEKIERLNNNEFLRNFKSFGYFKTNIYQAISRFMSSKAFEVFVMGHSCGLSDRVLLNSIFENANCKRIKLYYHQITKSTDDYIERTMEVSRHFREKNKMRNIISPYTHNKPLMSIEAI